VDGDVARRRIAEARVGRLASVRPDGTPHLVPICFALVDDRIVTAVDDKPKTTPQLQRLANIRAHPEVTLLVDDYSEDWSALWWARADGTARVVDDGDERDETLTALREKYDQYAAVAASGAAIVIDVTRWSGWAYAP
jgi:PPOX class probable F420-dependent enzyme